MSLFFLLNNLHFALEILGAIAFMVVAWLSVDSFILRKDFTTATRWVGFGFLAIWQAFHAFNFSSEVLIYSGYGFYFLGLIFIIINLLLEAPVKRPEFKAIVILPGLSSLALPLNIFISIGLLLIAWLSYRQFKKELKKALTPFIIGFAFLSLGALTSIFYDHATFDLLWILGHLLEFVGFLAIGYWVWSYLHLRVREEMLLIFVSVALFMAVIVSLSFSTILSSKVENETKNNLITDAKVLNFTLKRLQGEAEAKSRLFARNEELIEAMADDNFLKMEKLATEYLEDEDLGFLIVTDKEGFVILRAHALSKKGDALFGENAVDEALEGEDSSGIESSPAEGFSIRAASPIISDRSFTTSDDKEEGDEEETRTFRGDEVQGLVISGFLLDDVFVDSIKKLTGLEMSIFADKERVASTIFSRGGQSRVTGTQETNKRVIETVFSNKEAIALRTEIASKPFLASYFPILDSNSEVVGMLSSAKPQQEIVNTTQATNRLTLIVVIIIMLVLSMPIYFITKRLTEEVG